MTPEILLLEASATLVPGATGRVDVAREARAAVVDGLCRALAVAAGSGDGGHAVEVVVVAPAVALRARWTDEGVADLGALGLLEPAPVPAASSAVRLGQAASVAHVLLHLAGWTGTATTLEVGGEVLDPGDVDRVVRGTLGAEVGRLVVFATVSTGVAGSSRPPLPSGAPANLVSADAQVLELHAHALRAG